MDGGHEKSIIVAWLSIGIGFSFPKVAKLFLMVEITKFGSNFASIHSANVINFTLDDNSGFLSLLLREI